MGAVTLITNVAFLISMPLAIIFVHRRTLVYECLNLLIINCFSLWGRSTFLPSLYTLAAIAALVTDFKYSDSSVVKSVLKA